MEAIFANMNPWVFALIIFLVRVVNMAVDTVRMLTMMRGMRTVTFILGAVQTALFVIALGSVISDLNNPLNILSYSLGFATGNVIGMMIEKRLAFGYINMTIMSLQCGQKLAERLRADGHAVTEIPARGKDGNVVVLECSVQRKFASDVQQLVLKIDPGAFITTRDIQRVWKGYWHE